MDIEAKRKELREKLAQARQLIVNIEHDVEALGKQRSQVEAQSYRLEGALEVLDALETGEAKPSEPVIVDSDVK